MLSEQYPDTPPKDLKPIDSFTFNIGAIETAKKDTDLQIQALEVRIERIVDKFQATVTQGGMSQRVPVLSHIISVCRNSEDLKGLALGLERIADLVPALDLLQDQKRVLDLAEKNPSWFAWAFADFETEFEASLDKFIEDNLENPSNEG
jgi:hypothetical protein